MKLYAVQVDRDETVSLVSVDATETPTGFEIELDYTGRAWDYRRHFHKQHDGQRNTSMSRLARARRSTLRGEYVASTSTSRMLSVRSAIRWPKMNRWFFGKLSTRSSSHFVTSYHLTSRTGGSLRVFSLMRRVRMVQKNSRAAFGGEDRGGLLPARIKGKRDKGQRAIFPAPCA